MFFITFFSISCNNAVTGDVSKKETKTPVTSTSSTPVTTAKTEFRAFQYLITSNGKIKSLHELLITSENGGKVSICKAETGAFFPAGSVIAQLETTPLKYKLQRAQSERFNAQKDYESQLLGYGNLLKDKTEEQADTIRQKLKISTGLVAAEDDIKEAQYELSRAIIRAPFSGILADVKVQQGEQLKAGQELFRIYDPNNLFLEVKILEADIALVKKGMQATIASLSAPEQQYVAEVYEINPYVDENGMVLIKLKIQTSKLKAHTLFPGMNCTATIKIPFERSIVVPKEAVVIRSGKTVVFTIEDGKAKWNYVTVSRDNGKEVEIKDGLKAGAIVITSNNLQLAHDAPVEEVKDSLHAND
jgi:RND family efflux transporter MFP subunit